MTHLKGAVWTERLLLVLILASLAGTLNLVLAIHRRVIRSTTPSPIARTALPPSIAPSSDIAQIAHTPPSSPKTIASAPVPAAPAPKPVEDPTAPILARMDLAIAREAEAARQADRRAATLEAARKASASESERWKRREMLVRQQVATLSKRADKLERNALSVDAERDVLARERDALKAALVKGSQRSGYSILPYKGPNGTWRRPIVLECTNNSVKLQPNGPSFSMMELSPLIHPRSSPVVLAIAREMVHIQQSETPDGAPAVPYLVFLVRPDGIRPYYQARARLESLGIAFGYELVEQELAVEIPNFDDVKTWDGSVPLEMAELAGGEAKTRQSWPATTDPPGGDRSGDSSTWPGGDRTAKSDSSTTGAGPPTPGADGNPGTGPRGPDLARADGSPGGRSGGSASSGGGTGGPSLTEIDLGGSAGRGNRAQAGRSGRPGDGSPDDFVWPTSPGDAPPTGGRGNSRAGRGTADDAGMGNGFAGSTGTGLQPGSPSSAAGRAGSDLPGGGTDSQGRVAVTGRFSGSSPGGDQNGGRAGLGRGNEAGSGAGNGDPLPNLEPVQDGSLASDGSLTGTGSSAAAGGSGGPATGRLGTGAFPMGGGARNTTGGAGQSPAAAPGAGMMPAGASGAPATDPGFAAYPGGSSAPVNGGLGASSSAVSRAPTMAGAISAATPGPAGTNAPGSGAGSDAAPDSTTASNGPSGTAQPADTPSSTGSLSATQPQSSGSGSAVQSSSSTATSAPAAPGTGGLPPTPLEAALARVAPLPSSASASASGGTPSSTADAFAGSPSGATGSASSSSDSASGTTSSSSALSSSGMPGGQPPSGMPAAASGMSLPSVNMNPDPDSEPDFLKGLSLPPIDTHRQPGAIEVPFEIVVVCRRDDLLLHPGGYRITAQSLRNGAGKDGSTESLLKRELRTMVRRRAQVDPLIRPKPRLKFLVETGGGTTFWTARQQLLFSNLEWPMTVQVAGPQTAYKADARTLR